MTLKEIWCSGGVAVAVLVATVASAQTLADVARAEEARRKTVKEPAKVYTNDDLKRDARDQTAKLAAPAPATGSATPAQAEPPKDTSAKSDEPVKDQAYWKGRITQARDQLERSKTFLEALQSRVNALNTDFVNRDDPAQRAVVEKDRQKALAEIDRVRKEIAAETKATADIEEEARRAGVPPGWLR